MYRLASRVSSMYRALITTPAEGMPELWLGLMASLFCAHFTSSIFTLFWLLLHAFLSLSYIIIALPMRKCCGQHSWRSFTFSIATLIGICSVCSVITAKNSDQNINQYVFTLTVLLIRTLPTDHRLSWIYLSYLNFFRLELLKPADGTYGVVKSNGTVTGMIGLVARRETHFAINQILVTGDNNNLINVIIIVACYSCHYHDPILTSLLLLEFIYLLLIVG